LKVANFLLILITAAAGLFYGGCGIEEPMERVKTEGSPRTSELPSAYNAITLKQSSSADVLAAIKQSKKELLSQSESVIASWGEKKKGSQLWLTAAAFDEEDLTVTRKYFLAVDEKPWHLLAEGQKLRLDIEMIADEKLLSEPYSSENEKRIAVLKAIIENMRDDITQIRQDSRIVHVSEMITNQGLERILYVLTQSPAMGERLSETDGLEFDHLTMGRGRVRMLINGEIVKLRMIVGKNAKNLD
jgi:hypothetical protein